MGFLEVDLRRVSAAELSQKEKMLKNLSPSLCKRNVRLCMFGVTTNNAAGRQPDHQLNVRVFELRVQAGKSQVDDDDPRGNQQKTMAANCQRILHTVSPGCWRNVVVTSTAISE